MYSRHGYPGTWTDSGTLRHTAIGMLIGFGLGAALGAKANTDQTPGTGVRAAFAVGCLGAMLGAAVGVTMPSFDARNRHPRRPWPDEDERDQLASPHRPTETGSADVITAQPASGSQSPSQPAGEPLASASVEP